MLRTKLKNWLSWQPQPVELLALMRPVKPWPVQMDRYTRGIDNARVDVYLSAHFIECAKTLVHALVRYEVATRYWNASESQPRPRDLEDFRSAYLGLADGAMKQRQQLTPADWVRLVQLTLLKHLLLLVLQQIRLLRRHLEQKRDAEQSLQSGRRLEYHDRLVALARDESIIAYRVYQRLFKLVDKLETVHLRKLRKSQLGVSWPLPREAMFNILLQLPNLLAESEAMYHYPMLAMEEKGKEYLAGFNHIVIDVFKDFLPTWTQPRPGQVVEGETGRFMDRLDQGGLPGFLETEIVLNYLLCEDEYKNPQYSWLDDPDNLTQLLEERQDGMEQDISPGGERKARHWRQFRHAIREELDRRVEKLGILPRIVASYWTPRIHKELRGKVSARLIYEYLTGQQTKRKVLRRLVLNQSEADPTLAAKTLDFAASEIKQLTRENRREFTLRILMDFLALRRDLKLAYKTFESMDGIRILKDEEDINLSRANGLLYEFRLVDEQTREECIHSHVILKADLRGSTRITAELRAKKLNPATHFSQNFFNPINEFLDDFGAKKVFVEGDAVILSFMEQSGGNERSVNVAHACGLGTRILGVVSRQNRINRRHGLPDLELGIGIAFCDEEPTFLYDGDKQIMISPAINLADRLSSCTGVLHNSVLSRGRPFRVEVLAQSSDPVAQAEADMEILRYNVNGIELDGPAFAKLRTEMVLHRLDVRVGGQPERFHAGRYPDCNGRMHWLVIREAPVRVWENETVGVRARGQRCFYEVIVEPGLMTLIRSKLRSSGEQKTAPAIP